MFFKYLLFLILLNLDYKISIKGMLGGFNTEKCTDYGVKYFDNNKLQNLKQLNLNNLVNFKILLKENQVVQGMNYKIIFKGNMEGQLYYYSIYYYQDLNEKIFINNFFMSKDLNEIISINGKNLDDLLCL